MPSTNQTLVRIKSFGAVVLKLMSLSFAEVGGFALCRVDGKKLSLGVVIDLLVSSFSYVCL
jgi:hypothetical protein